MRHLQIGSVALTLYQGDLRNISVSGIEVLRRVSYPVRDPNWGTHPIETTSESLVEGTDGLTYAHHFQGRGNLFQGQFRAAIRPLPTGAQLHLSLTLIAPKDIPVNRAGFTLLHPLKGVSGHPLTVTHPDGTTSLTHWPEIISPSQPVYNIAGLQHRVNGITATLKLHGDIFEMEDQRNWSDASFKTYCRPLALPLPYVLGPDSPLQQEVEITLTGSGKSLHNKEKMKSGSLPQISVAVEPGLTKLPHLPGLSSLPRLLRVPAEVSAEVLSHHVEGGPLTLEVVLQDDADPAASLATLAAKCSAAKLAPDRVVTLCKSYMKSYQPDGVWPSAPPPMSLIAPTRAAFPAAEVGGGMFTNFTELNRCRPNPGLVDFVTWGGTAIVHAADDLSVLETLEALPQIFASGRRIARDKPLHLGLFSIGMRSNPYAPDCLPNPLGERLAMVRDDPRQATSFAAAFAVGVLAAAATEDVSSLALSMTDGPLGAADLPLQQVVAWAAKRVGMSCKVEHGAVTRIVTASGILVANLGPDRIALPDGSRGVLLGETRSRGLGGTDLPPLAIAFLEGSKS